MCRVMIRSAILNSKPIIITCNQLIIVDNTQNMSIGLATVRGHREMKSLQNCSALASIPNRQDRRV